MSGLKNLAKDTAIYGMSSIIGRFLNYLLVPLYVGVMSAESGEYGIVTNVYAIIALLLVILTYGMETGFFRYVNKGNEDPMRVYSTILIAVGSTSTIFLLFSLLFLTPISNFLGYGEHPSYLAMMLTVVAFDAFQCIPFAYLRYKRRPMKFAAIKIYFVAVNILLNLFFLLACPVLKVNHPTLFGWFDSANLAKYVFVANLLATSTQMLFFIPELKGFSYRFDWPLFKKIANYSLPILVLGIAGVLNQTVDKIIFPFLFEDSGVARVELGIYGAASKIAMIMAMFTQAFRYAYEPFVFGKSREKDNRKMYASAMKFFIIFTILAYLAVMFYLDLLKYILQPDYWKGLKVVPIVMGAEIFMGIYFNLSFWYKLIDQTKWGAYFSLIGCVVIISLNLIFVPYFSYMASAWAGFIGYALVTLLSYFIGQKKFPINYPLKSIFKYIVLGAVIAFLGFAVTIDSLVLRLIYRTFLLLLFVAYLVKKDLPLEEIPIINRFVKR